MSKNNAIRKSDKKFIRTEKARIRTQFFDVKKQQELINELYKRFLPQLEVKKVEHVKVEHQEVKVQSVKVKNTTKKLKPKVKQKLAKKK